MKRGATRPGTRIGKLRAVQPAHQNRHHQTYWLWQCDCGGQRVAIPAMLRRVRRPACRQCDPHWSSDGRGTGLEPSLVSHKIGLLKVLARARVVQEGPGRWARIYRCRCECGRRLEVPEGVLRQRRPLACPACLKRLEGVRSGESLRLARLAAGLTQTQAAARLGFSKQFWAHYERKDNLEHPRYDRLWQALAAPTPAGAPSPGA